jgi:hypothetical protein
MRGGARLHQSGGGDAGARRQSVVGKNGFQGKKPQVSFNEAADRRGRGRTVAPGSPPHGGTAVQNLEYIWLEFLSSHAAHAASSWDPSAFSGAPSKQSRG